MAAGGVQVRGDLTIQPGTAIATFDNNGKYTNSTDGTSHAAIYVGQDVYQLWNEDPELWRQSITVVIPTLGWKDLISLLAGLSKKVSSSPSITPRFVARQ